MSRFIPPPTESALNTWAAQKRSLYIDEQQPVASVMGQLRKDRNAAGAGEARLRQKWPEVYTGDGAIVEKICRSITEMPRVTLTYYYVLRWPWRVPIPDQARDLGMSKSAYWRYLEEGEKAVDLGLKLLSNAWDYSNAMKIGVRSLTGTSD